MFKIAIQDAPYLKVIGFVVSKIPSKTSVFIDSKSIKQNSVVVHCMPVHQKSLNIAGVY